MSDMFKIRPERPEDHEAVHMLLRAAFDGDEVPLLVRDLRDLKGAFPTTCLIAEDHDGQINGQVTVSHAWLDGEHRLIDVALLAVLGVLPTAQNKGIGTALIDAACKTARDLGNALLFVEGDHRYYGPRGFHPAMPMGFRRPSLRIPEKAFQVVKLSAEAEGMSGTFVYRDVNWRHGVGLYRNG